MKIMGHRGAKDERPENTLKGIQYALDCGVDGVEIDIHSTLDEQLVVIHDPTLDRTTNSQGLICDKKYHQLKALDAGEGEKIPLLSEVLDLMKNNDKKLFIEIKAFGLEKQLLTLLSSFKESERIILKCFNHRWLKEFSKLAPQYKTAALMFGLPVEPAAIAQSCGAKMLSLSVQTIDAQCVSQAHSKGIEVCAWNANNLQTFEKLKEMQVDWIGTDCPSVLIS